MLYYIDGLKFKIYIWKKLVYIYIKLENCNLLVFWNLEYILIQDEII